MGFETWHKDDYLVSTDSELLQVEAVNAALGSDMVWWAGELPTAALQEALRSSLCFGVYQRMSTGEPSNGSNGIDDSLGKWMDPEEAIRPSLVSRLSAYNQDNR